MITVEVTTTEVEISEQNATTVSIGVVEQATQTIEIAGIGPQGAQGIQGEVGPGVPAGGTAGQLIVKDTAADYDTSWVDNEASNVLYDNTDSGLSATLVQTAIDELQDKKLDVAALTSSVTFFPTTAASDISGYGKLVTNTNDPDYDTVATTVNTGAFTGTDHLVGTLASDAGILEGSTTPINITTIGNVRRVTGNLNDAAEFYFEVYKRDSGGAETLIGTSAATTAVRQSTFEEFYAVALISDTVFTATDRVVLRFYGSVVDGPGNREYAFQYGGGQPVRSLFPVPVTVIPHFGDAKDIIVDASVFSGLLSGADDDVQAALETLDALAARLDQIEADIEELQQA